MDIFSIEIGKKVAKLRKKKKITQQYLGVLVGKSRASITNMELGRQNITLRNIYNIALALKCNIEELLPDVEWYDENKNRKVRVVKTIEIYEDE